jgi:DNA-binding GntR family transcriptional regulator
MDTEKPDQTASARKSANWRNRMKTQGQLTFRVQLPKSIYEEIKRMKAQQNLSNLGDALDQIISNAAQHIKPSQLKMPPVVNKTVAVHDITTVLSSESIGYLSRIKTELGLARATAIHAILITKPEAVARKQSKTEAAYFETRFQILTGAYAPGTIIDREALTALFDCSSRTILDALCVLNAEGYLETPKRGMFAVRVWDDYQLQDFFGHWSAFVAMAATRATERASMPDLIAAVSKLSKPDSFDFATAESTERHAHELAAFNADLIRLSQSDPLLKVARAFVPNSLMRKAIFASSAKQLMADRKSLEVVGKNILHRAATSARNRLEQMILRPLPILRKDAPTNGENRIMTAAQRSAELIRRNGCEFGLGGREPTLEGVILPYGMPLSSAL